MVSHTQVAKENKTTLPSAGLFIIRYHSFYGKKQDKKEKRVRFLLVLYIYVRMPSHCCILVINLVLKEVIYIAALHKAGAYEYLMSEEDTENLKWLKIFK